MGYLNPTHGDRRLVWGDDFTSPEIDRSKWFLSDMMTASDMRREACPETMEQKDGMLTLRCTKFVEPQEDGKEYHVPPFPITNSTMEFRYGYFEIRAKIPFHYGNSGAFWFCATKKTETGLKPEIDMVELLGSENNVVSNLHTWGDYHTSFDGRLPRAVRSHTFPTSGDALSEEFHTYSMDWTPDAISFAVDGETYCSCPLTEEGKANFRKIEGKELDLDVFRLPVYFILSEFLYTPARKLGWGLKGDEAPFVYTLQVEHVALYQRDGEELFVGDRLH